jgi:hypothetical protein
VSRPYSWNEKAYKYKIEESVKAVDEVGELDQYVFVVRVRIGEYINPPPRSSPS